MTEIFSALVGVNFRPKEAKEIVKALEIGDTLSLESDPGNPYDANAVKVIHPETETFIGFLSRESNMETAAHLNNGCSATATVVSFLATLKPHLSIRLFNGPT